MKHQPITLRSALAVAFGVIALATSSYAGETTTPVKSEKAEPASLLSFYDGALVFDFDARARFEIRNNNRDFDSTINDDNDDSWVASRLRLGVAIKPVSFLKFYFQGQDVREWDSDRPNIPGVRGSEGPDAFDLRQAYVEIADYKAFPLGITIGRQRLAYGDNRLIADGRWSNFGRTYDAVKLRYQSDILTADGFFARVVQIKEEVFNDSDSSDNLAGLYLSSPVIPFQTTDLYYIFRDKEDAQPDLDPTNRIDPRGAWNGPAQRLHTVGTRWKSNPKVLGNWDYTVELAAQFGDLWTAERNVPALSQLAFAGHVSGGYTFSETPWKPRIGLEYNYGSGDNDPNDGDSQSFQNLYPSNHERFGYMDVFSWRNVHNLRAQISAKPTKAIDLELSYHAFWLADTSDYWFRSNGNGAVRTVTPDGRDVRTVGAGNFVGHEIDVVAKWSITKCLALDVGYSHFFAADYLEATGPADDADFAYAQMSLTF